MNMNQDGLKALIERLEKRNERKKMTVALAAAVVVLGGITLFSVQGMHKKQVAITAPPPAPVMTPVANAYAGVPLQARAAIVYDLTTGTVLYEKNARAQLPLASLTKLLTTYAAVTTLSASSPVSIGTIAVNDAGDLGFTTGETFRFEDIAQLALVASSNVAAEAVAHAAEQKRAQTTSGLLASAASAIGLSQTYAVNPSGLDESTTESGGYGSAYDIAKLSGALLEKAPSIARATTEPSVTVTSLDGTVHTLANTNPDVSRIPDILLSKTGYTDLAGGNLVVVYDAGINHPVAVVVLGSTVSGRFVDVQNLISRTLKHFSGTGTSTPS